MKCQIFMELFTTSINMAVIDEHWMSIPKYDTFLVMLWKLFAKTTNLIARTDRSKHECRFPMNRRRKMSISSKNDIQLCVWIIYSVIWRIAIVVLAICIQQPQFECCFYVNSAFRMHLLHFWIQTNRAIVALPQ